ncbi:MAG TPA: hypothetical protein VHE30_20365 [Polyangiaceae bacterium]|nr:hypothetical protein [Polyangiaceae bacterium]
MTARSARTFSDLGPRVAAVLVASSLFGCGAGREPARSRAPAEPVATVVLPEPSAPSASAAAPSPAPPAAEPIVVVADPGILAELDRSGFDAGTLVTGSPAHSTRELAASPAFRAVTSVIAEDLARDRAADPASGVGMRFAHRQFDPRWLASDAARFELVGVVNRLDRRPFAPEHCGEVRFVYRLAYSVETKAGRMDSRLPMTLNVVSYQEPDAQGSCKDVAGSWLRPAGVRERGEEGKYLVGATGPLAPERRARWVPKSVETNFQSVRWPSTVRPSMAGHAEYVLRVFRRTEKAPFLVPAPLENTPDVARLSRDPALRGELLAFLRNAEVALDRGTLVVPERFLATRAVSVSPHGLARRANRLYRSLFSPEDVRSAVPSGSGTIASPVAFLRRLDAMTCPGCHQSRSIAGFHFLGVEPESDVVDALAVPMSPHFHAELERRRPYVTALAEGRSPDEFRPFAEHAPGDDGVGARCGLGDPGFSAWTCGAGLACVRHFDDELGECEPVNGPGYGDSCESGPVTVERDPHRDSVRLAAKASCGEGRVCEENAVGFPGGMCSGGCDSLPPGATCGGIALLTEFNDCLAAGTPFDRCVAQHTRPGAVRACGFHAPCRDDYVCARGPNGAACIPPYFTFQLRVDGHPL